MVASAGDHREAARPSGGWSDRRSGSRSADGSSPVCVRGWPVMTSVSGSRSSRRPRQTAGEDQVHRGHGQLQARDEVGRIIAWLGRGCRHGASRSATEPPRETGAAHSGNGLGHQWNSTPTWMTPSTAPPSMVNANKPKRNAATGRQQGSGKAEYNGDPIGPALHQAQARRERGRPNAREAIAIPSAMAAANGGDQPERAVRQKERRRHGGHVPSLPEWRKGRPEVSLGLDQPGDSTP